MDLSSKMWYIFYHALKWRTINLQRQSINDTREEAKKQSSYAREQKILLDIQRFETTFFNMLDQRRNIINGYRFNQQEGASYFQNALYNLWNQFEKNRSSESIDQFFEHTLYHIKYRNFVLHIANIIKIIQTSNLKQEDKFRYYEILNRYLTDRQKYFIELCSNSSFFNEVKEQIKLIHRSEKKWIK